MTKVSSKILLFDIETNGFLEKMDKVHVISYKYRGDVTVTRIEQPNRGQIIQFVELLNKADRVVAHNGAFFDIPALQKMSGKRVTTPLIDTLILSSILHPDIAGGHGLEAWGMRLRLYKGDYAKRFKEQRIAAGLPYNDGDEWLEFCDDMARYCDQDVVVLDALYTKLIEDAKEFDWKPAFDLEHRVAALIAWQERNGWQFDIDAANAVLNTIDTELRQLDTELADMLEWKVHPRGTGSPIKKCTAAGKLSARFTGWIEYAASTGVTVLPSDVLNEFCPVELKLPDLGSRQQMIELLIKQGWKPTEYTEKGNPKFTEDSITAHIGPLGQKMARRFVCITRRGQVSGWLSKLRADGRIVAGAMPCATPTARMRHRTVVNVPRIGTPYGEELRALFIVPSDRVLVGADASGLELRMLAHYMGDDAYTDAVVNGESSKGTDVHTINCKLLGLEPKKIYEYGGRTTSGRDIAKTFIYALLYGAGDAKIGSIIDGDEKVGKRLRNKFLKGLPKYAILIDRVSKAAERGWIRGIDGRKIFIRHKHAALNSLLQSAGSIMVKKAMVHWAEALTKQGIPFKLVGTFHDEVQAECPPEYADVVGQQFCDSMRIVGQQLNMRCELAGEYKVGKSWRDCH